jgi:alkylation response protein AidB-like acyl-CoA dehydrogenase
MTSAVTDNESKVIETARVFAQEMIRPQAAEWAKQGGLSRQIYEAAAQNGLVSAILPKDCGGQGVSMLAAAKIAEALAAADFGVTFALKVHANAANAVARRGTERQRERYLADMIAGRSVGAFCLTEPGVGSDATAITCRAESQGDGWLLNGTKAWVTNGAEADVFAVYAQTDPAAGWRGIATFLVDGDMAGVRRGEPYRMTSGHAAGVCDIMFEDCRLNADALLVPPGEGFKAAMAGINMARMFVAAICCGMMADSLNRALEYGVSRVAFGKPVLANQGLQWGLADVATDLAAAQGLTEKAAAVLDEGKDGILECAFAKKFTTGAAVRGISACMQAMGARGLRDEEPFGRHMAAAKMCEFLDGTTEIQNVVISRTLLRPYGIDQF